MFKLTKMEGCGNDFLVLDQRRESTMSRSATDLAAAARVLCHRHFGVGADGLLVVDEAQREEAVARMRVFNADGSEAEMCGNGIRCVAKLLHERDARLRLAELPIETAAGLRRCRLTVDARRHVTQVAVSMGQPRLARAAIPMTGPAADRAVDVSLEIDGRRFGVTAVSMGNPHAVIFLEGDAPLRPLAERFGPAIEGHAWFPERANVGFARWARDGIELVVWERGCGVTLACGTGASAAAVAACLTGRAETGREIPVRLPGGTLGITVDEALAGVTLRGPAEEVFEVEIDLAALLTRDAARGANA